MSPAPVPALPAAAAGGAASRAAASAILVLAAAVVAGSGLWVGGLLPAGQAALAGAGLLLGSFATVLTIARGNVPVLGRSRGWFLALAAFAALQAMPWPVGLLRTIAPYSVESRGLAGSAGAGVRASLDAGESWRWALLLSGLAFFSYALAVAGAGRSSWLLRLGCVVLVAHASLALALGRYHEDDRVLHAFEVDNPLTAFGSFANQSQFGAFVVVLLGAPLALWRVRRGPFDRALAATAVAVAAVALVRSDSRASLAGLALALAAAWVLSAEPGRRRGRAGLVLGACVLLVAGRLAGIEPLERALPTRVDEGIRLEVWKGSLDLGMEQPAVGTGFGSFPYAYSGGGRADSGFSIKIGENQLLHTFAEIGVVGCLLVAAALWTAWTAFRRRLRASAGRPRRSPLVALSGFVGLLPCLVTSVPLHTPAVLAAAVLAWGGATALAETPSR